MRNLIIIIGLLLLAGCSQPRTTVNVDKILTQIATLDPDTAASLTEKLFSIQQKRELAELKVRSEVKAYERQERAKLLCIFGMGVAVAIIGIGFWFTSKLIIGFAISGILCCGTCWGLIIADIEYGRTIGIIVVSFCAAFAIVLLAAFIYSVIKYRKALVQVVLGNEVFKKEFGLRSSTAVERGRMRGMFNDAHHDEQDKATEVIVDEIRERNKANGKARRQKTKVE